MDTYLYDDVLLAAATLGADASLLVTLDPVTLTALVPAGLLLTSTLDAITVAAFAGQIRKQYGTRFCRVHRLLYIEDDRFPAPCATWGGHAPGATGG
jgi:hypothetical protein